MTTVVTSFVAIVLFGLIMIGTVSYGDSLGFMAAPDSVGIAQRMETAAEMVSSIQANTGSRPTSGAELYRAGLPEAVGGIPGRFEISCSNASCSPMALCMVMASNGGNVAAVNAAAGRVKGTVSGACGTTEAVGSEVVLTMLL